MSSMTRARSQSFDRSAKELFDARGGPGCAGAQAIENDAGFAFTKAEAAKAAEGILVEGGIAGADGNAIRSAVGVAKLEAGASGTFDDELASMLRSVVRGAQEDHAIGIVVAPFGAKDDVVDVEKQRVLAAGNDAAAAVAANDCAARRGPSALTGAANGAFSRRAHVGKGGALSRRTHMGAVRAPSEGLNIACCHGDDRRPAPTRGVLAAVMG
jgi:hypothetical protein